MSDEILKIILVENEAWRRVHAHWCELHQQHVNERADWRQAVLGLLRERERLALAGVEQARQPSPEVAFANGVIGKDRAGLYQSMKEPQAPEQDIEDDRRSA